MTGLVMNYTDFKNYSLNLDKQEYKLPVECIRLIYKIKKRLNIKDISDARRSELFEKPVIVKKGEILNDIYKNLNKISQKTYDKLSKDVLETIKNIEKDKEKEICNKIFEIITNNDFYCDLYAKLYSEMIQINRLYYDVFHNKVVEYLEDCKKIVYVSPNENYDNYCNYIKQIDKIKNFTNFLIKCLNYQICDINNVVEIVLNFQKYLIDNFDYAEKIYENENYISNVFIIIKETIDFLSFHDKWEIIKRNICYLHEYSGEGKNNKIKFKIMDINDIINNYE